MFRLMVTFGFVLALSSLTACVEKAGQAAPAAGELPAEIADVQSVATRAAESSGGVMRETPEALLAITGEFVSPEMSNLAIRNPGRVSRVVVDAGERVRAGQPMLYLETEYLELDVDRARAEAARAEAAWGEAKRELERKELLRARESVPVATLDRALVGYEQASAAHDAAKAMLATAEQRLADAVLRAPFDGVVIERRTAAGERLSERMDIAFVIARTSPLRLRFDVPERLLAVVKEGQVVKATADPYPGETFVGRIDLIGQTINPATRTFFVEAGFPNTDGRLKPGLFARVELEIE
jgi:RND family efflux transporter MFP subunit